MLRALLLAAAVGALSICLQPARAKSLPSFQLPWAAQAATGVVVVEDGKISEVWVGEAKVGDPFVAAAKPAAVKVTYGFFGDSAELADLIDKDRAERGFKRIDSVSGRRRVYFVLPEPPFEGVAQMISRSPDYTTAWLEDGQAFAIQQMINPGPAQMRPLDITEADFKQAVLDLRAVGAKLQTINKEQDRAARGKALVALLKHDNRWWNEEVRQSIQQCGREALPAIEAALADKKQAASHVDLIYLAHGVAGRRALSLYEAIVASETEYFRQLDAAGQKYDRKEQPHWPHEQRRLAAQWAIDSK